MNAALTRAVARWRIDARAILDDPETNGHLRRLARRFLKQWGMPS